VPYFDVMEEGSGLGGAPARSVADRENLEERARSSQGSVFPDDARRT